jgi:hypothetical protein
MKNFLIATAALPALFLFTSGARAQSWDAGYPKTGTVAGIILADANVNLGANLQTTGKVTVLTWNVGGGLVKKHNFTIKAGQTGMVDRAC